MFHPGNYGDLISESIGAVAGATRLTKDDYEEILLDTISAFPAGGEVTSIRSFIDGRIRAAINRPAGKTQTITASEVVATGLIFSAALGAEARSRNCVITYNGVGSIRITLDAETLDRLSAGNTLPVTVDDTLAVSITINGTEPRVFTRTFNVGQGIFDIEVFDFAGAPVDGYSLSFAIFSQPSPIAPPYNIIAS